MSSGRHRFAGVAAAVAEERWPQGFSFGAEGLMFTNPGECVLLLSPRFAGARQESKKTVPPGTKSPLSFCDSADLRSLR